MEKTVSIALAMSMMVPGPSFAEEAPETAAPVAPVEASREPAAAAQSLDDVINRALKIVIDRSTAAKGRVAVMDFQSLEEQRVTALSAYVANKAGNRLIDAGRQVVDRAALEKIISEQKLQQNSLLDASTAAKVGRLAGAGVFIVGNYSILRKKFVLTVRALSVETGQFIAAAEESAPFNEEFLAEVNELHKRNMAATGSANLNGEPDSEASTESAGPASDVDFDKKVCAMVNRGIAFGKIVQIAEQEGLIDFDEHPDGLRGIEMSDSTGELKSPAYVLGQWVFITSNWAFPRSSMGEATKGKFDTYYSVSAWIYNGSNKVPGLDRCSPNPGWWTERRAAGAGKKKK